MIEDKIIYLSIYKFIKFYMSVPSKYFLFTAIQFVRLLCHRGKIFFEIHFTVRDACQLVFGHLNLAIGEFHRIRGCLVLIGLFLEWIWRQEQGNTHQAQENWQTRIRDFSSEQILVNFLRTYISSDSFLSRSKAHRFNLYWIACVSQKIQFLLSLSTISCFFIGITFHIYRTRQKWSLS